MGKRTRSRLPIPGPWRQGTQDDGPELENGSLVVSCVLPKEDAANLRLMIGRRTASYPDAGIGDQVHTGPLNPGGPADQPQ